MGTRFTVRYQAPEGRRVNAIGLYFSHGPLTGDFLFDSVACLPKRRPKQLPDAAAVAARHGLQPEEVGTWDSERFLAFVWQAAGRPPDAPADWRRARRLVIVLDNYAVHKSEAVRAALPALAAADIHLFYLPAYSPELSAIEPIWQDLKHHRMPVRSFATLGDLKREVDAALARKQVALRARHPLLTNSLPLAA